MGHEDLIAALRAQGAEKASEMQRQAEEEEARIAAEGTEQLNSLEKEENLLRKTEEEHLRETTIAQARVTSRRLLAASRCRLAERLPTLARDCLFGLRNQDYETTFALLVKEIPDENWRQVRVNPADTGLARKFFPTAPVVEDAKIIGGFELLSADGLLRITNTLEKRLERSWPALLPGIIAQLEKEA